MNVFQRSTVDHHGEVIPNAEVTVRDSITSALVQLYSDYDGDNPIGNPTASDADGFVRFYVAPGRYQITVDDGSTTRVWEDEVLGTDSRRVRYELSAAESGAGIVETDIVADWIYYGNLKRYGAITGGDVSLNAAAWQAACAQAASNAADSAPVFICRTANGFKVDAGATVNDHPIKIYGDNAYNSFITSDDDITLLTIVNAQQVRGPVLEDVGFISPTGSTSETVHIKNSSNGRISRVQILKGSTALRFEPTATAPNSCYSWSIVDAIIANATVLNIDAEENTHHLRMANVTFGAGAEVGLRLMDSSGLSLIGGDCEGCTSRAIDLDATVDLAAGHYISGVDFETNACTLGIIRIGATAMVRNVTIVGNVFNNAGSSEWAINPVRCEGLTVIGNSNTTGFNSGYAVNPSGTTQRYFAMINNTWQSDHPFQLLKGAMCFDDPDIPVAGWSGAHASARVAVAYSASMTLDASLGNIFDVVITNGSAMSLTVTNGTEGQEIVVHFFNTSGGAHGTITMSSPFKLGAAMFAVANANNRQIKFGLRLGSWFEATRSPADVAN